MNTRIIRAGAVLALLSLSLGVAKAGPPKKDAPECPVCHMKLSAKKTKDSTVAVKLTPKSKTMYCCDKCKMPDEVLVKPKTAKKK
ncbi:MAG: hypothetical protein JWL77_2865 [Chthonomonadaceae bacterium]|nr:hypothetical protein [Chthonomonadaceae bacterium]